MVESSKFKNTLPPLGLIGKVSLQQDLDDLGENTFFLSAVLPLNVIYQI